MSEEQKQKFLASGKLISISEAANLTPYSAEYLSLLARKGKLQAVKIARDWLTTQAAVLSYTRAQQEKHERMLKALTSAERGLS